VSVFESGGKSGTKGVARNAIDQAGLVLDRERPGWKCSIRAFGLSPFDLSLDRLNQLRSIRSLGKLGQIEGGCGRLTMNAGDERRDRMALPS
jgi:hypothetical protein